MFLFDISNAFTSVQLKETISIYADVLYRVLLFASPISEAVFMEFATESMKFSFSRTKYRQIDGITMASPLGPALVNIFVGFHEHNKCIMSLQICG